MTEPTPYKHQKLIHQWRKDLTAINDFNEKRSNVDMDELLKFDGLISQIKKRNAMKRAQTLIFKFTGREIDTHESVMINNTLNDLFPDNKILIVVNTNMEVISTSENEPIQLYEIKAKDFDEFKTLLDNATKQIR